MRADGRDRRLPWVDVLGWFFVGFTASVAVVLIVIVFETT